MNYARNQRILSSDECGEIWGGTGRDESVVCIDTTDGKGVCSGDSGGPLNLQTEADSTGPYVQVGIASFVSGDGCESTYYPHGFARVTFFLDWIKETSGIE